MPVNRENEAMHITVHVQDLRRALGSAGTVG